LPKIGKMLRTSLVIILFSALFPFSGFPQHEHVGKSPEHTEAFPPWRIAILLGHTLIPDEQAQENFFIPSWGLDIEYWMNETWGIGIHNDLEVETFVLLRESGEEEGLERNYPLVLTLDALYKPWKGLVFQFGPGIELEKSESFPLMRMGVEYEIELNPHWDLAPSVFYDTRFSEYHTWSIAIGIGKRFGS